MCGVDPGARRVVVARRSESEDLIASRRQPGSSDRPPLSLSPFFFYCADAMRLGRRTLIRGSVAGAIRQVESVVPSPPRSRGSVWPRGSCCQPREGVGPTFDLIQNGLDDGGGWKRRRDVRRECLGVNADIPPSSSFTGQLRMRASSSEASRSQASEQQRGHRCCAEPRRRRRRRQLCSRRPPRRRVRPLFRRRQSRA